MQRFIQFYEMLGPFPQKWPLFLAPNNIYEESDKFTFRHKLKTES